MTDQDMIKLIRLTATDADLSNKVAAAEAWRKIEARFTELSMAWHPTVRDLQPKWETEWRNQFDGVVQFIVGGSDGI